jgi:acyl-CoA thioesterase
MTFARAAGFDAPIDLTVEELRRGRTFSTLAVRCQQGGKLVAPAMVLLDAGASDVMRETVEMPDVPEPEMAVPYDMRVTGRDLRIVDGAYSPDPDLVGPPAIHAWVRFRDNPDELCLRNALVAQATTHWTIAASMRPHPGFGEAQAHVSLSTGPIAVALAFHDDVPLDDWFLYTTTATWSGQGLAQGEGRVFSRDGALIASYTLQAMVRSMMTSGAGKDATTAM